MELANEERELILARREEERAKLPKQEAYLKHDLYMDAKGDMLSLEQIDQAIAKYRASFKLVLLKGTRFVCHSNRHTAFYSVWSDDTNCGIANRRDMWAKEHLRDIADIPRDPL